MLRTRLGARGPGAPRRWALAFVVALLVAADLAARAGFAAQSQPVANVRGIVWYDDTGSGVRRGGEPAAAGAQIILHPDPGLPGIYANEDGTFAVSLPDGRYTIEAWWDGPGISARAPGEPGGAYASTTVDLAAGATQEVSLGVRPTGRFPARVDAKIEVVWPHAEDGQPASVADAPLVNVLAYLFHAGTRQPVPCSYSPRVSLIAATDDGPGQVVAQAMPHRKTVQGRTFPVWEFNNVDVRAAQDPARRVFFWLDVADELGAGEGSLTEPRFRTNVWAHAQDGRTRSPAQLAPRRTGHPDRVAARIDVVWPHDAAGQARSVDLAPLANVDVLLLDADAPDTSVSAGYTPDVWLLKSRNGAPAEAIRGKQVLVGDQTPPYPKWVFEDVDVGGARDPSNRYYFRVAVAGRGVLTNVWAHGLDGRTSFAEPDVPSASGLGCEQ